MNIVANEHVMNPYDSMLFNIPFPQNPITGTEFAKQIWDVNGQFREDRICQALLDGHVPAWLRTPVELDLNEHVQILVLPDVLCIGTSDDYLYIPAWPATYQKVANAWNACLITQKLSDLIWSKATHLAPNPLPPSVRMSSTEYYVMHSRVQQKQYGDVSGIGKGDFVAGHKKDVVVTPSLLTHPKNVAIYGWHQSNGIPIQGGSKHVVQVDAHSNTYVDYSHGCRLLCNTVYIDNEPIDISQVYQRQDLHSLFASEPFTPDKVWWRYPL
jgi:hypothetical protein